MQVDPSVKKLLVLLILVVLLLAGGVYALRDNPFWSSFSSPGETPKLETSFPVLYGQLLETVTGTGVVQPQETLVISTDQAGRVVKLLHDVNDVVEEGEELLQLDDQVQQQKRREAQAAVEAAQAAVEAAQAGVAEAQAKRKAARNVLDRVEAQHRGGSLTQEGVDARQADFDAAEKGVRVADATVKSYQAKLQQAKEALAGADLAIRLTHVSVPVVDHPARTGEAAPSKDVGEIVSEPKADRPRRRYTVLERKVVLNQLVGPPVSAQLFVLSPDINQVQVNAQIAEGDVHKVRAGMKAYFTVSAYENHYFTGAVTEVKPMPTVITGSTYYTAVITVDSGPGEDTEWRLQPGMTTASLDVVYKTVPAEKGAGIWMVPDAAVNFPLDKDFWEPDVKDKPNPADDEKWIWVTDRREHTAARPLIITVGATGKVLDEAGNGLRAEAYTEVKKWDPRTPALEPGKEAPFDVVTGAPPPRKKGIQIPSLIKS
jgi:HlyD family secretion protein